MVRRTKEDAYETKLRILAAAEEIFFVRGVTRTSLDEIAAKAGVTRGAIYWHFENKADLFKVLYDSVRLPQDDIIERAVAEGSSDPIALLETTILGAFSVFMADRRRQRVFTILNCRCEYVDEMSGFLDHQRKANERLQTVVVRAFALAKDRGILSSVWEPLQAARVFMNFVVGIFTHWIRFGRGFDLVAIGAPQVKALLAGFRAPVNSAERRPLRRRHRGGSHRPVNEQTTDDLSV